MSDLVIASLRGGLNDSDPPHLLADDQCTIANNVEFFFSTLCERRKGCEVLDLGDSGLNDEDTIAFLTQWFPLNDPFHPEFWSVGVTAGVSTTFGRRATNLNWDEVTPVQAMLPDAPNAYTVATQDLNAKLFFSYPCETDRFHVWDGDTLRPTGIDQPAVPTLANEGSGSYSTDRFFRVRFIKKDGSTILLRSEPSDSVLIAPSGSGAGVRITRPVALGEGETHWEVEASVDDSTFYVIATVILATTTYDDETDLSSTDYADVGEISEDIGSYELIPNYKFVIADGDRLIFAGHRTDESRKSEVAWTPVTKDPGVGNDERLPLDSLFDNRANLDTTAGGEITGISQASNGTIVIFKWSRIYTLTRLYRSVGAYASKLIAPSQGAIYGSVVGGVDENGRACIYFIDPQVGPSRYGTFGLQTIRGVRNIWKRMNQTATIAVRALYYPDKQQIKWWIAVDGSDTPSLILVLQTNEIQSSGGGAARGWSTADGFLAGAYTVAIFNEITANADGDTILSARPFMGYPSPDFIQRGDSQSTDAGHPYTAVARTKAFLTAGLLNQWEAMTGALLATANASQSVQISFVGDFGRVALDTQSITTDLAPVGSEEFVIKKFDSLHLAEATAIQVEFSDVP